jgi:hypothetical protein
MTVRPVLRRRLIIGVPVSGQFAIYADSKNSLGAHPSVEIHEEHNWEKGNIISLYMYILCAV